MWESNKISEAGFVLFKGQNRDAFHQKLQILCSITHSHAMNEPSIIVDTSNYIRELKHKVETLQNQRVCVETLEQGFLVNVHSRRSCPGLLALILATFEEMGLNVLEARVSCQDTFQLQALGGEEYEEDGERMDAQLVKRTISNTIKNWKANIE